MFFCLAFLFTAEPYAGEPRSLAEMDKMLSVSWTRQSYIKGFLDSAPDVRSRQTLQTSRQQGKALGRYYFADIETLSALYQETSKEDFLFLIRDSLLHEAKFPSLDDQFALARIAGSYARVREKLSDADREIIDDAIAKHADDCVKKESGTEMNRGMTNLLGLLRVCKLLPDHPNRSVWEKIWKYNWEQGLLRAKDNNEDCIDYNHYWLYTLMQAVHEMGIDQQAFYNQPWVKEIFERHLNIRTPLGTEPETIYGTLSLSADPAALFEWAGAIYKDGRYRWAAQRSLNFLRSQPGNENKMVRNPVFLYVDDSVVPIEPSASSYYSQRRYDREFPNKLALRSGYGPDATFLALNLFNVGGHGLADGSAVYCLMDQYGLLLSGGHRYSPDEQFSNLLLIRPAGIDFPFGHPLRPDIWNRTHVNLRGSNTTSGGLNVNLCAINQIGLRIEGKGPGKVTISRVVATGKTGSKTIFDGNVSIGGRWPSIPLSGTVNLEDYEGLEIIWKYDSALKLEDVQVVLNGINPKASARWAKGLDNWRDSRVRFFGDAAKAHFASVEVDVYAPDSNNHRQYRDMIMLPNHLVWVRDTMVWGGAGEYQAGALWHVEKLLGKGTNWFQTSSSTVADKSNITVITPPRFLLIVFPPRADLTIQNALTTNAPPGGRSHTVFQKWNGMAAAGRQTTFNSLLIPNDGKSDPVDLAAQVELLFENDQAAVLKYDNWRLVDNPDGSMVTNSGFVTDYCLLAVKVDGTGTNALYAAGLGGGTNCLFYGKNLSVEKAK